MRSGGVGGSGGVGALEVGGWSTTTEAELQDLDRLAAVTRAAAARLAETGSRMSALAASPDLLASTPLSPVTAAAAEWAVLAATTGPRGAIAVAATLEATGLMVEAAAATYRQAEHAADGLVAGSQFLAGLVVGAAVTVSAQALALLGSAVGLAAGPELLTGLTSALPWAVPAALHRIDAAGGPDWTRASEALQSFVTGHPELLQQLGAAGGGLLSGAEIALAPGLRETALARSHGLAFSTRDAALDLAGQYIDGEPVVMALPDQGFLPDSTNLPAPAPAGIGDLYAGLADDIAESGLPGRITVSTLRTQSPDGTAAVRYIVNLPGMDSCGLPGHQSDDARDNSGNLRLVGGLQSAYTRGVAKALALAGAPPGATVALVGHSQGGLAAVELADDASFRHAYTVTHVLTAAAPISRLPKNPAVDYLSLENAHDIVPRMDGASTVALANLTVVRFSSDTGSVGGNHDMQLYASAARRLDADAASDADLRRYLGSLAAAGFLVGHRGGSIERRAFRITSDRRPARRRTP